jgi:predicted ABC-type ATPase
VSVKELTVIAGPNGAGKSTFAIEFLSQHPCPYLSADAIAAELAPSDPTSAQFEAGREFLARIQRQLAANETFLVETTLSGRTFRHVVDQAKASGFEVTIIFVYLDSPDTCVARVKERVRGGGHDVPEMDIRRRFSRSLANFWKTYRHFADHWVMVYNSSGGFLDVAFGTRDEFAISDEDLFRRFLEMAEVESHG